jgi:hypothetical protein
VFYFAIFVGLLFGTTIFLTAWLLSVALYASNVRRYASIDWFGPAMNIVMALALYLIARRANRVWPIFAASLQLLIVLAMIGRSIRPDWMWQVYLLMTSIWPYLELTVLLIGTIAHWRREATMGPEPPWSGSSPT